MRTFRTIFISLLVAVVLVSCIGCGSKTFVTVNGTKVKKDEFYSRLEKVPVQTQSGAKQAGQYIIEQIVNEKLILEYAKNKGVSPTKDQINKKIDFLQKQTPGGLQKMLQSQDMTKEELEKKIEVEQALVNVVTKGVTVSDTEIKTAYNQALNAPNSPFKRPEQVNISIIVCKTKTKIDKAYTELQRGMNFNNTAESLSDDPTGKMTKGQIGWVSKGMKGLPTVVANKAFSQSPNEYSEPMFVDGEYVIVKTEQKRPAKTTQYDEVKDAIKEQIALQKGNVAGSYKTDLRNYIKKAEIKINSSKYKNIADNIKKQAAESDLNTATQPVKPAVK